MPRYRGGNVPPTVAAAAEDYAAAETDPATAALVHAAFLAGAAHVDDATLTEPDPPAAA